MTADQLITYLSWAIYFAVFVITAAQAARRPTRASIDVAVFFAVPAALVVLNVLGPAALGLIERGPLLTVLQIVGYAGMIYMLLRLVDDFAWLPRSLLLVAEAGLAAVAVAAFVVPQPLPMWYSLLVLAYLLAGLGYATVAFLRAAQSTRGVTRRRMRSVAAGTLSLALLFVFAGFSLFAPGLRELWTILSELAGLMSSVFYFMGFVPPPILRRAWQEPELRSFLSQATRLSRLPDTESVMRALEAGAAQAVGAPHALIGLWDQSRGVLKFTVLGDKAEVVPDDSKVAGRAFLRQKATTSADVGGGPGGGAYPDLGQRLGAHTLMAAPVTAGDRRVGVLAVYATRSPIFADEDIAIIRLLADQAAVVLETRALIDESAQSRAREETARMKEDFLSAAAHDLKTPLTTLVAQAQLLERKAQSNPSAPADIVGLQRIVKETIRLRTLVMELLDAARAEQGKLVGEREQVDLAEFAREVAERHDSPRHPVTLEAEGGLSGLYDPVRILQLLENLVENAVKYSPDGGPVRVRAWREGEWNRLSVADRGIGIPPAEMPMVFSRFYRGANVDDRRFSGMGLGLFICRAIAEQHGGSIWVASTPGKGSTFDVRLPAVAAGRDFGERIEEAAQAAGQEVA